MARLPFFSLITASFNAGRQARGALASVVGQSFPEYELLVQDKESTDRTRAVVDEFTSEKIRFVSEPDTGVFDAWNKAVSRARGEWLLFLGADDRLFSPHVLTRAARTLCACGSDVLFAQGALALGRRGKISECLNRSRCEIFMYHISGMPLLMPAVFLRRALFETGSFDASYSIAGDYAFVAERLAPENLTLLPFIISYMEAGGLSSSPMHRSRLFAERRRVLAEIVRPRAGLLVDYCIATMEDRAAPLEDTLPPKTEFDLGNESAPPRPRAPSSA